MSKTLVVKVFRYDPNLDKSGCYQAYTVPYFDNMDVIDALRHIQNQLDPSLTFRYSCEEGKCGLCGVLVNGKPALACKHVLAPGGTVTIDPLSNFPVIKDLVVNRDTYYEEQRTLQKEIEDDTGIRFGIVEKHQIAAYGAGVFSKMGGKKPVGPV